MKNLLIITIFLLLSQLSFAQIKGADCTYTVYSESQGESMDERYGEFICVEYGKNKGSRMAIYKTTAVGYMTMMRKVVSLCIENDLDFNNPYSEANLIPSYADGLLDYESMHLACSVGSGTVFMTWKSKGWVIIVSAAEEFFAIIVTPDN